MAVAAPTTAPAPAVAPGSQIRPFAFTHLVANLAPGTVWASPHAGMLCIPFPKQVWRGGHEEINSADLVETFRSELTAAGFKVANAGDDLFESASKPSDLQVGGLINDVNLDYCMQGANLSQAHGSAEMRLQWQIYSSSRKTMLAKIDTRARFNQKTNNLGGRDALVIGAFKENVRALIADPTFRSTIIGPPLQTTKSARTTPPIVIPLAGALGARSRPISDEVSSVVTVLAEDSLGSGFLVSTDGLLLTAGHVVGSAKTVTVRWSDGIETPGEVLRANKVRDVALIRTLSRGRPPLPIRRDVMQPGDSVFVIGTPIGEIYQNTVTKGVISSYRIFDGLKFIQSDARINPGNSGGPLLDEKGSVVGLTESTTLGDGIPTGINLFTPAGDALDFLGAEPK
jgi:S1-C subfamily serine protease